MLGETLESNTCTIDLNEKDIRFCLFNCTGYGPKKELIQHFIRKEKINLMFLTETWVKVGNNIPSEFLSHSSRVSDTRGSRGVVVIGNLEVRTLYSSPSGDALVITCCGVTFMLCYFAPALNTDEVQGKLTYLINQYSISTRTILLGDFNCHHTLFGDKFNCSRGIKVVDMLMKARFKLRNTPGIYTYV
jgi:hypothetical protein